MLSSRIALKRLSKMQSVLIVWFKRHPNFNWLQIIQFLVFRLPLKKVAPLKVCKKPFNLVVCTVRTDNGKISTHYNSIAWPLPTLVSFFFLFFYFEPHLRHTLINFNSKETQNSLWRSPLTTQMIRLIKLRGKSSDNENQFHLIVV